MIPDFKAVHGRCLHVGSIALPEVPSSMPENVLGRGGIGDVQADHWGLSMLKLLHAAAFPALYLHRECKRTDTEITRVYVPGTVVQPPNF